MYKLSEYVVISEPFYEKGNRRARQVVFSGVSGQARIVHPKIVNFLSRNQFADIPDPVLEDFLGAKIMVKNTVDEGQRILAENRQSAVEEEVLYHVIQPSAWCQLGCGYCGQSHEKKTMDEGAVNAVYRSVVESLERRQYKHLHIGWFGSEPLTGMPVIRSLSRHFKALAVSKGLGYTAKIVTNGMALTSKVFRQLTKLNVVHYEVTLDGPEAIHNQSRPGKDGTGSYQRIIENLKQIVAVKENQRITIRVNVGINNVHSIPALIEAMWQSDLQRGVSVYFAPLHDWGNDAGNESMSIEDFSQHELMWYSRLMDKGFQVALLPTRKKLVCMSLSPTSQVYDTYGDIFNCSELSQVPSYGTPNRHRLGNLNLIASTAEGERLFSDFNDKIAGNETTCKNCYCLPVCGGACPKAWDEGNIPCPSFKFNFKQRLLLQYAAKQIRDDAPVQPDTPKA